MQTIYVDIYFLINFTLDLLSLHLASAFTKIYVSPRRLLISSIIGGLYSVVLVFLPKNFFVFIIGSVLFFGLILFLCTGSYRTIRKIKYIVAFLMMQIIIGGMVYFSYGVLERAVHKASLSEIEGNKNLLILALVVLLSIGVLKILLMLFRNNMSQSNAKLKVIVFDKEYFIDALIDSGNFAKDPMDMSPVMLVKRNFSEKIFPYGIPDILKTEVISDKIKKRIRAVPISTATESKILCGFRPDSVFVLKNKVFEKINLTIAFDEEGGSFAGYDALIPLAALENL